MDIWRFKEGGKITEIDKINNKDFYLEIEKSLPVDFKKFTEVFLSCHTYEADNFWDGVRWETFPEDEAIFIDTDGKLERFYAIRSIKMLKKKTIDELENIDLNFDNEDFNRDLALLAKNENLKKIFRWHY